MANLQEIIKQNAEQSLKDKLYISKLNSSNISFDNISNSLSGKTINETAINRQAQQENTLTTALGTQQPQFSNPDQAAFTNIKN